MKATNASVIACVLALGLTASGGHAQECGDADDNGAVNVSDGVQALRAAAELPTICSVPTCDVDGNGAITVADGVLVLRKAAELPIEERCAGNRGEMLDRGARLALVNNPFYGRGVAAAASAQSHAMSVVPAGDVPEMCPGGGFDTTTCEIQLGAGGILDTVYDVVRDACTFPQSDGSAVVEAGFQRLTIRSFASCAEENPRFLGREITEERFPLVFETFDSAGNLTSRSTENDVRDVLFGERCDFGSSFVLEETARNLAGTIVSEFFVGGLLVGSIEETFIGVTQAIERSPSPVCAPTHIRSAGSIEIVDELSGETYTTTFGEDAPDLRYRLEDGTRVWVDGGLSTTCGGGETAFGYRTVEPMVFVSSSDECPRGGLVEVSVEGVLSGEVRFTNTGGVEMTDSNGATRSVESCNSEALLLVCE